MGKPLPQSVRRAYLEALDVELWRLRGAAPEAGEPAAAAQAASVAEAPLPDWDMLAGTVAACTRCELHRSRRQTVFGVGSREADWMIIGEAPGAEEDRRGEPFVGRAGRLLDEMLHALGLDRSSVFIANILKCRPPGNRDPRADEAASCRGYLERQITLLEPRIILAVGRVAAQNLLGVDTPIARMRGQRHELDGFRVPVVVTYHPAYLLRDPAQKRKAWQDLLFAQQVFDESFR